MAFLIFIGFIFAAATQVVSAEMIRQTALAVLYLGGYWSPQYDNKNACAYDYLTLSHTAFYTRLVQQRALHIRVFGHEPTGYV